MPEKLSPPTIRNLLESISPKQAEEIFEQLEGGHGFRLERIISEGHKSPVGFWYEQPEWEWVLVLQGEACLEFENSRPARLELKPGDSLTIPGHQRHRVAWTSRHEPTIWLALHYESAGR